MNYLAEEDLVSNTYGTLYGHLLGFTVFPTAEPCPVFSIFAKRLDWIEREIHEEFAIDFAGREYEPLFCARETGPEVNLHEVAP